MLGADGRTCEGKGGVHSDTLNYETLNSEALAYSMISRKQI